MATDVAATFASGRPLDAPVETKSVMMLRKAGAGPTSLEKGHFKKETKVCSTNGTKDKKTVVGAGEQRTMQDYLDSDEEDDDEISELTGVKYGEAPSSGNKPAPSKQGGISKKERQTSSLLRTDRDVQRQAASEAQSKPPVFVNTKAEIWNYRPINDVDDYPMFKGVEDKLVSEFAAEYEFLTDLVFEIPYDNPQEDYWEQKITELVSDADPEDPEALTRRYARYAENGVDLSPELSVWEIAWIAAIGTRSITPLVPLFSFDDFTDFHFSNRDEASKLLELVFFCMNRMGYLAIRNRGFDYSFDLKMSREYRAALLKRLRAAGDDSAYNIWGAASDLFDRLTTYFDEHQEFGKELWVGLGKDILPLLSDVEHTAKEAERMENIPRILTPRGLSWGQDLESKEETASAEDDEWDDFSTEGVKQSETYDSSGEGVEWADEAASSTGKKRDVVDAKRKSAVYYASEDEQNLSSLLVSTSPETLEKWKMAMEMFKDNVDQISAAQWAEDTNSDVRDFRKARADFMAKSEGAIKSVSAASSSTHQPRIAPPLPTSDARPTSSLTPKPKGKGQKRTLEQETTSDEPALMLEGEGRNVKWINLTVKGTQGVFSQAGPKREFKFKGGRLPNILILRHILKVYNRTSGMQNVHIKRRSLIDQLMRALRKHKSDVDSTAVYLVRSALEDLYANPAFPSDLRGFFAMVIVSFNGVYGWFVRLEIPSVLRASIDVSETIPDDIKAMDASALQKSLANAEATYERKKGPEGESFTYAAHVSSKAARVSDGQAARIANEEAELWSLRKSIADYKGYLSIRDKYASLFSSAKTGKTLSAGLAPMTDDAPPQKKKLSQPAASSSSKPTREVTTNLPEKRAVESRNLNDVHLSQISAGADPSILPVLVNLDNPAAMNAVFKIVKKKQGSDVEDISPFILLYRDVFDSMSKGVSIDGPDWYEVQRNAYNHRKKIIDEFFDAVDEKNISIDDKTRDATVSSILSWRRGSFSFSFSSRANFTEHVIRRLNQIPTEVSLDEKPRRKSTKASPEEKRKIEIKSQTRQWGEDDQRWAVETKRTLVPAEPVTSQAWLNSRLTEPRKKEAFDILHKMGQHFGPAESIVSGAGPLPATVKEMFLGVVNHFLRIVKSIDNVEGSVRDSLISIDEQNTIFSEQGEDHKYLLWSAEKWTNHLSSFYIQSTQMESWFRDTTVQQKIAARVAQIIYVRVLNGNKDLAIFNELLNSVLDFLKLVFDENSKFFDGTFRVVKLWNSRKRISPQERDSKKQKPSAGETAEPSPPASSSFASSSSSSGVGRAVAKLLAGKKKRAKEQEQERERATPKKEEKTPRQAHPQTKIQLGLPLPEPHSLEYPAAEPRFFDSETELDWSTLARQLKNAGYVVVPFLDKRQVEEVFVRRFLASYKTMPELNKTNTEPFATFKNNGAVNGHVDTPRRQLMESGEGNFTIGAATPGAFGGINMPSGNHVAFSRLLRTLFHEHSEPLFVELSKLLAQDALDRGHDDVTVLHQHIFDRWVTRRRGVRQDKESTHRDLHMPATGWPVINDTDWGSKRQNDDNLTATNFGHVFGGWVGSHDRVFSAAPGSHTASVVQEKPAVPPGFKHTDSEHGFSTDRFEGEYDRWKEYIQQIYVPAGSVVIFYQTLVHNVTPSAFVPKVLGVDKNEKYGMWLHLASNLTVWDSSVLETLVKQTGVFPETFGHRGTEGYTDMVINNKCLSMLPSAQTPSIFSSNHYSMPHILNAFSSGLVPELIEEFTSKAHGNTYTRPKRIRLVYRDFIKNSPDLTYSNKDIEVMKPRKLWSVKR